MQVDEPGSEASVDSLDPGIGGRQLVEIRCGFAELARREAEGAESRVVEARRAFDAQLAVSTAPHAASDLGATRAAKEEAHSAFRKAVGKASSRFQVEAAAASWLEQINRINGAARADQLRIQREHDAIDALASEIDRLTSAAEASRAMADAAVEACRAAREALAATHGAEVAETAGSPSGESTTAAQMVAHAAVQAVPVEAAIPEATPAAAASSRSVPAFAVLGAGTGAGGGQAGSVGAQAGTSAAEPPVTGGVKPILISGSAATATPLPIAATATSATSATDKNRFPLAMPSSFSSPLPPKEYCDQRRYPALERHRSPAAARNSTCHHCKNRGNSQAGTSLSATSS